MQYGNMRCNKLRKALGRCKHGKLILIKNTQHPYYVSQALRNGLKVYCNMKNVFCGPLEPPVGALETEKHTWWQSKYAELYVSELARMLDSYSPKGWHFHVPIFGIILEWGWFRNYFFENNFRKEI